MDHKFLYTKKSLFSGAAASATRRAVFGPLYGRRYRSVKNAAGLLKLHEETQKRLRLRLTALYQADWRPLHKHPPSLQYARNCPPFSVWQNAPSQPCKRHRLCPNCHARMVTFNFFRALEHVYYGDPGATRLLRPDLRPWLLRRRVDSDASAEDLIRVLIEHRATDRQDEAVGSMTWIWLSPSREHRFATGRSTILLLPRGIIPSGGKSQVTTIDRLNRAKLAGLVAQATPYPASMLHGDLELTIEALNATTGRSKMQVYDGVLRTRGIRAAT